MKHIQAYHRTSALFFTLSTCTVDHKTQNIILSYLLLQMLIKSSPFTLTHWSRNVRESIDISSIFNNKRFLFFVCLIPKYRSPQLSNWLSSWNFLLMLWTSSVSPKCDIIVQPIRPAVIKHAFCTKVCNESSLIVILIGSIVFVLIQLSLYQIYDKLTIVCVFLCVFDSSYGIVVVVVVVFVLLLPFYL